MPSASTLFAFAVASLVLIAIPGPSVVFAIARALSAGRVGGLVTVFGNTLGQVPLIAAVAYGVGAIVASSAVLFTSIKLLGAGYLVYLGIQAIRHRSVAFTHERGDGASDEAGDSSMIARPALPSRRLFWEGFVVGVTNPKSIVFFIAVLPQFVDPVLGSPPVQMMILGCVFIIIALLSDSTYVLLAGTARAWFAKSSQRLSRVRALGGALLIGLGVVLAFTGTDTSA